MHSRRLAFFAKAAHNKRMNDHKEHNNIPETQDEDLKHFDMYHFFSRKDVLLAITFIVVLLLVLVFKTIFAPQTV